MAVERSPSGERFDFRRRGDDRVRIVCSRHGMARAGLAFVAIGVIFCAVFHETYVGLLEGTLESWEYRGLGCGLAMFSIGILFLTGKCFIDIDAEGIAYGIGIACWDRHPTRFSFRQLTKISFEEDGTDLYIRVYGTGDDADQFTIEGFPENDDRRWFMDRLRRILEGYGVRAGVFPE